MSKGEDLMLVTSAPFIKKTLFAASQQISAYIKLDDRWSLMATREAANVSTSPEARRLVILKVIDVLLARNKWVDLKVGFKKIF